MNEIKLMNALGMIGEDELCNYFEYSETLAAKTRKRIRTISVRVAVAAVILLLAFAILPAMFGKSGEASLPGSELTSGVQNVIEDTDPPVSDETTSADDDPEDPFSYENVLLVDISSDSARESPYYYTTWEGLDISGLLEYGLERYKNDTGKYFVINVFRRNGDIFYSDYVYEGKTQKELADEILMVSHKASLVKQLIQMEGEILKYGKEIITGTGVPTDDPLIDDSNKGVRWAESRYDQVVNKYNSCDPEMLSRYIVDGDFLSELAESDLVLLEAEYDELNNKQKEMREYYFQRHEEGDLALLESLGFTAGEINGKLYIFATHDQLRGLSKAADMSQFSFTPLSRDDYLDAYPVSKLPDDYKLERSVSGFDLNKFKFTFLRKDGEKYIDVTVSSDEEFYSAIEETIHKYKRGDLYIELQFFAKRENGSPHSIDPSELEGLKYSGYKASKYPVLTAVKLRFEDFNDPEVMAALRDLSRRNDITSIEITHCFYVP